MAARARTCMGAPLAGRSGSPAWHPLPPGVSAESAAGCTRCGHCVEACPEDVLSLGPGGIALIPEAGECSFCGICAEICPEPVFAAILTMVHVAEIGPDCFVASGVSCIACRDACPEAAISLVPRIGGPFLPRLDASACTGCNACVVACPAGAIGAVPLRLADMA